MINNRVKVFKMIISSFAFLWVVMGCSPFEMDGDNGETKRFSERFHKPDPEFKDFITTDRPTDRLTVQQVHGKKRNKLRDVKIFAAVKKPEGDIYLMTFNPATGYYQFNLSETQQEPSQAQEVSDEKQKIDEDRLVIDFLIGLDRCRQWGKSDEASPENRVFFENSNYREGKNNGLYLAGEKKHSEEEVGCILIMTDYREEYADDPNEIYMTVDQTRKLYTHIRDIRTLDPTVY